MKNTKRWLSLVALTLGLAVPAVAFAATNAASAEDGCGWCPFCR